MKPTPIQQFYANSTIFITGGTGFLGTVLVEKLLRSCPNIHMIYLLVRSKHGMKPDVRMTKYFDNAIFDKMKEENSNYRKQVVFINGDISEPGLALSEKDRIVLIEEVNFVFHLAATINFNERLRKAILINIRGTRDVLALSKQMKKIKFIMHVSTAYSHCQEAVLEEKIYETPYNADQMIAIAENSSAEFMDKHSIEFLGKFPNTYTFTKSISEGMIASCNDLPIAIFRPAVVVPTIIEPIPGWLTNSFGATYVIIGAMAGLQRCLMMNPRCGSNLVPVDMCTNSLIAIPWQCRNIQENCKIPPIYNYETNSCNFLSWGKFAELVLHYINIFPSSKMIGEPFLFFTNNLTIYNLSKIMLQKFPASTVDFAFKCMGKPSNYSNHCESIDKLTIAYRYFLNRDWNYKSENILKLYASMTEEDQLIFYCDLRKLEWYPFFKAYVLGCRTFLLKEDLSKLKYARKKQFYIKFATRSMILIMLYSILPIKSKL